MLISSKKYKKMRKKKYMNSTVMYCSIRITGFIASQ